MHKTKIYLAGQSNDNIKEKSAVFCKILNEIPEIRYAGDPILRSTTQKVSVSDGIEIGERLGNVLQRYRKIAGIGRGLAAPQIGLDKKVFVTFVDNELQTFINAEIIEKSPQTNFYKELCLSSGIMAVDVERPEWIVMSWTDAQGNKYHERIDGFLARLYQHEEAHLRGIINLDEAAPGGIEIISFDPLKEKLREKR